MSVSAVYCEIVTAHAACAIVAEPYLTLMAVLSWSCVVGTEIDAEGRVSRPLKLFVLLVMMVNQRP